MKEGNEEAFRAVYEKYWLRLFQLCFYYTEERVEAEDMVADIFMSLWNNRNRMMIDNLEHYLVKAAKNKSLKYMLTQQRRSRKVYALTEKGNNYYVEENSPERSLEVKELSLQIHQSLQELPKKTKKIFLLNRENGLTYEEIAGQMGVSVKTVEYHVSKALRVLSKYILLLVICFFS